MAWWPFSLPTREECSRRIRCWPRAAFDPGSRPTVLAAGDSRVLGWESGFQERPNPGWTAPARVPGGSSSVPHRPAALEPRAVTSQPRWALPLCSREPVSCWHQPHGSALRAGQGWPRAQRRFATNAGTWHRGRPARGCWAVQPLTRGTQPGQGDRPDEDTRVWREDGAAVGPRRLGLPGAGTGRSREAGFGSASVFTRGAALARRRPSPRTSLSSPAQWASKPHRPGRAASS